MNGLLILFALDVLGKGVWLLPLLLVLLLLGRKRLLFRGDFFLLLLFAVCYLLFDGWREMEFYFTVFLLPLAFLTGLNWSEEANTKTIESLLLLFAGAMAVHGGWNLWLALTGEGSPDVWTRAASSATAQMLLYAPAAALAGGALIGPRRRLWRLVPVLVGLVHTVELGGRTLPVLLAASLIVGAVSGWIGCPEERGRLRKRTGALLGAGLLSWIAVGRNWAGLGTWFENSYLYRRRFSVQALAREVDFFQTDRWALKGAYWKRLPEHLFGGGAICQEVGNYAHDLFLDVWDRGSVFAFALLLIYVLRAAIRWRGVIGRASADDRPVFLCWAVTMAAVLLVEPVLQGAPLLLCGLVLLDGMAANLEQKGGESP